MLSLAELTRSVMPTKERPPSVAVPTLPFQSTPGGASKLFQSWQLPPLVTARLPSASSKPVVFAIVVPVPQPVAASSRFGARFGKSAAAEREEAPRAAERLAPEEEEREE